MSAILQTSKLQFAHSPDQSWVFDDIELNKGEHLLILGGSGSGKTTLLHLLSGLLRPISGKVLIDNVDISGLNGAKIDEIRGTKIGMVFQRPHFIQSLNVKENIALAGQLSSNKVTDRAIEQLMEDLNIRSLAYKKTNQLSEGEKQRVSIARALADNPLILLADEPTSALDDTNCAAVIKLLIDASKKFNCTLVVVTHDARIKSFFPNQMTIQ